METQPANTAAENTEKTTVNNSSNTAHTEAPTQTANTAQTQPQPEATQPRYIQIQTRNCGCSHASLLEYANFGLNLLATAAIIYFIIKLLKFSKKFE